MEKWPLKRSVCVCVHLVHYLRRLHRTAALMVRCVCHDGVCACVCIVHVYMGGCLRLA